MSVDLSSYIAEALAKTNRHDLIRFFQAFVRRHGFTASRYLVLAKEFRLVSWEESRRSVDFPAEWVTQYRNNAYFDIDPLLEFARKTHEPFYWREVIGRTDLTDSQREYLNDLKEHGFGDGLAVPVYARPGEIVYFGLGSKSKVVDLSRETLLQWQFICQVTHQRYEELLGPAENLDLTPRETEVISWILRGKSNSAIATILGVSGHTVDTLVRRCFRKLGAANRLEASLTAMSRGLGITLPLVQPE